MPEPKDYDNKEDWMTACIPTRIDEGDEQDQAVAVCMNMWNDKDKKNIEPEPQESETLVMRGDAIKALGNGRIGGYLITFSTQEDPDLEDDFFDKTTDFGDAVGAPVYYHHGLDPTLKRRKFGKATHKMDDFGIWAEAQLQLRDEYEQWLYEQTEAGRVAWSSGTASHLVEREQVGKAWHITSWPLGLDDSLTITPAEPRNTVTPLKSLSVKLPSIPDNLKDTVETVETVRVEVEEGETNPKPLENSEGIKMEITEEKLSEMLASSIAQGVEQAMKALPVAPPPAAVEVETDEADQPFETPGEFFKAVKVAAYYPSQEDPRLRSLKATGMSEGVPADGGYLLQPAQSAGIMEKMLATGEILSRVSMDNVSGNSMVYNGIDESSHASHFYGGVLGYWLGEGGTKTASAPKFYQLELKLKKIAALCYCTDEQLEDTAALESWLMRNVPNVLRFQVEDAIINGDGVGKPLGIMLSPCLCTQVRDTASHIYLADIANMWSRRYLGVNDYVWLASSAAIAQLNQMLAGTAIPAYMPPGGISGAPYGTIYGRPVIENEYCAALNTKGDLILASLSQYQSISKGGVQSASSIHVSFTTDETAFRFVYRIDGAPAWNSELTTAHGDTVSPFVCLSTACAS